MKINLIHSSQIKLTLSTDHDDPDKAVTPSVSVDSDEVSNQDYIKERLISELNTSYGFYGHLVSFDSTTNLDLSAAVRSLPSFELVSIEPEIMPRPLPDDVNS